MAATEEHFFPILFCTCAQKQLERQFCKDIDSYVTFPFFLWGLGCFTEVCLGLQFTPDPKL
jgi:hypothetical protein